jgi:cyclic pyranopterin phosphate synthase
MKPFTLGQVIPSVPIAVADTAERASCVPDVTTLTTNASRLSRNAPSRLGSCLKRITVSLDAIDETVVQQMTGVGYPSTVRLSSCPP